MRRVIPFVLAILCPAFAEAQVPTEQFQLQTLDHGARETSVFGVSIARVGLHLEPTTDVVFEYMNAPLEVTDNTSNQTLALVEDRLTLDFGVAVAFWERLQLDLRASSILYQNGPGLRGLDPANDDLDPFAFGDVRAGANVRLVPPDSRFGLALRSVLYIPTGSTTGFASDGVVRFEPRLVGDVALNDVTLAANVGYQFRANREIEDYRSDDAVRWGAAARWEALGGLGVDAAVYGSHSIFADSSQAHPVEAMGGFWWSRAGFTATVGAGRALNTGVGSPALRVLVSLAYRPGARQPWEPQRQPAVAPKSGGASIASGGDGVAAEDDQCPYEAEDVDGFEDDDGCPDPDNDQDGLSDFDDACPNTAGVAEKSGCPLVDIDEDGVDDAIDACLDAAEDIDQFEDEDGCPEADNDGDGIVDADDQCPNEAEVVNGNEDEDGCPDEGQSLVTVQDDRIEILERVYFDNDRATIKQRSYSVLEQVAVALKNHPEIERVAIEGHTDSRGGAAHNRELSNRRARAVKEFLESRGVEGSRLRYRGYGASHPIADNATKEGRAANRRVEFLILRTKTEESP